MIHYNSKYFQWQKQIGQFGGRANLFKFEAYIKPNDNVLEFGCGGGYLLKNILCKDRIGIEINPAAREVAKENGIYTVKNTSEVPNLWADIIISNHALEHTLNPFEELKQLNLKLKKNGYILFVVPQEFRNSFKEDDINMHLYTWSPCNLGNLFVATGFKVIQGKTLYNKWPPYFTYINKILGNRMFRFISTLYCLITSAGYQTWILAIKS